MKALHSTKLVYSTTSERASTATLASGQMGDDQRKNNSGGEADGEKAGDEQGRAEVANQETDHLSAEEADGPDTFYEEMFYNFAEDPYDSDCTYTYWSDGIAIERSWVGGKWQYNTVRAR